MGGDRNAVQCLHLVEIYGIRHSVRMNRFDSFILNFTKHENAGKSSLTHRNCANDVNRVKNIDFD